MFIFRVLNQRSLLSAPSHSSEQEEDLSDWKVWKLRSVSLFLSLSPHHLPLPLCQLDAGRTIHSKSYLVL